MILSRIILIFLVALLAVSVPVATLAEKSDAGGEVIAKVGNIVVSQQDLAQELQQLIPMSYGFHGGIKPETLKRLQDEAKQNLIDRAYKVQYAIDKEISFDAQKLETEWQKFKSKLSNELSEADLSRLKATLYMNLLAEQAEREAVDKQVVLSEDDVKAFYAKNKDQYVQPKLYKASHIFVKVDPAATKDEKEQLRQRAEALYERAKNGEDFYNLAYYESDDRSKYVGGKLGSFHAGQTVRAFDLALQEMRPGEIRGPVKTRFGYHVIRLDDVEEGHQLTYDEAAAKIRGKLEKDLRQKLYEEWMAGLQKKYPLQDLTK